MKWRLIKSAPKDQFILLAQPPYNHDDYRAGDPNKGWFVAMGRWIDVPHSHAIHSLLRRQMGHEERFLPPEITTLGQLAKAALKDGHWNITYEGIMEGGNASISYRSHESRPNRVYPTHWMPLPLPPKGRHKRPSL